MGFSGLVISLIATIPSIPQTQIALLRTLTYASVLIVRGCFELLRQNRLFQFSILNFPFIYSNISEAPSYGVYISQLIRYSTSCGFPQDFIDRALLLTMKLLNKGFLLIRFRLTFMEYLCHK